MYCDFWSNSLCIPDTDQWVGLGEDPICGLSLSNDCTDECGDDILTVSEECDDGNKVSGDGCSSACMVESAWSCIGNPSTCTPDCLSGGSDFCDDGNKCTTDECNASTGCTYSNNTLPCSNGDVCTTDDICNGGICTPGPALVCDDDNSCTTDSCVSGTGCTYNNNTLPCNDGDVCTANDVCSSGTCTSGPPLDCNDGNTCTDDSCVAGSGCTYNNNTLPCNDGDVCTTEDACSGGSCIPGPALDCSDDDICTTDSCEAGTGCNNNNDIPLGECNALVNLYNSTNGSEWIDNTGWTQDIGPCNWQGVDCSNGHVTEVDLRNNDLDGALPSTLGNLMSLTRLYLSSNTLTGRVPSRLGSLTNLNRLYLDGNKFCGEIPDSLPQLTSLTDSVGINIKSNYLFTNDNTVDDFLLQKGGEWRSSQGTPTTCSSEFPWYLFLPAIQR